MMVLLFTFLFLSLFEARAYAYLDPGSGSYLFQIMVASLVGAVFAIKTYWIKIKKFVKIFFRKTPLMTPPECVAEASSFRYGSHGFVFYRDGTVYRQINKPHEAAYTQLIQSGLYESLVHSKLLVPHKEVDAAPARGEGFFKIIQPDAFHS